MGPDPTCGLRVSQNSILSYRFVPGMHLNLTHTGAGSFSIEAFGVNACIKHRNITVDSGTRARVTPMPGGGHDLHEIQGEYLWPGSRIPFWLRPRRPISFPPLRLRPRADKAPPNEGVFLHSYRSKYLRLPKLKSQRSNAEVVGPKINSLLGLGALSKDLM